MTDPVVTVEDRLLALEYAAAVALCFAAMPLSDGSPEGREAAAQQVKRMMIALRSDSADTRNNDSFDLALSSTLARFLQFMGSR